jgi:hypothetical protein
MICSLETRGDLSPSKILGKYKQIGSPVKHEMTKGKKGIFFQ